MTAPNETVAGGTPWKWFVGMSPAIGWDMAFQARAAHAENLPEKIVMRRPSKLEIKKENGELKLYCERYAPAIFGAIGPENEFVMDRKLFVWIGDVTETAAKDWDEEWEHPRPASSLIVDATPADTKAIAQEVMVRQRLAEELRKNPQNMRIIR